MSLDRNARVSDLKDLWWQNYQRLLVWLNVGADVENGYYAIHGARLGCYLVNCTDWDIVKTREFDFYEKYWRIDLNPNDNDNPFTEERCKKQIIELGEKIKDKHDIEFSIDPLSPEQSKFFKEVYLNTPRIWKRRRNVLSLIHISEPTRRM